MMRAILSVCLAMLAFTARAADVTDATGRVVHIPDVVTRVLPAGPPAAVLMAILAPDLMIGWPHMPGAEAMAWLPDPVRTLPAVPMLTGRQDVTDAVPPLHPDLILDYGTVSPRYAALDQSVQTRTGIPTVLLDGALGDIPHALRTAGAMLGRQQRAETLAKAAEDILREARTPRGDSVVQPAPRVVFARGPDGLDVAGPGTPAAEVFTAAGWDVVAPAGTGTFRHASFDELGALDPDIVIFQDADMRERVSASREWATLRAVRREHAYVAPALPFGAFSEPPSINRLLGLALLSQTDRAQAAARFITVFYGQAPSPEQMQALTAGLQPIAPQ